MLLIMAWRNIWRNRNRSLITMASVVGAVLLAVFARSFQMGVFDNLVKNVVGLYTGYLQIHAKGYWEEQTLDNSFELSDSVRQTVGRTPGVQQIAPRLETFALIAGMDKTRGGLVVGIDPVAENAVTHWQDKITKGQFAAFGPGKVMLGEGLADKLNLSVGDTAVLLTQGFYGSTAAAKYRVAGLLHFGSPDLNDRIVYMPIAEAQLWLDAPDRVTALALALNNPAKMDLTAGRLRGELGGGYEVMRWRDMMPEMVKMFETDKKVGVYVLLGILYLLIAFGIFSTLLMMLAERKREFGMLIALGMQKFRISGMVMAESLLLSLTGAVAGLLISFPLVYYLHVHPMRLEGDMGKIYASYGFEPVMPTALDAGIFLFQTVLVFILAFLLGLFPAWRVLRLDPVEAMRS